jgi:hypothetical protein
MESKICNECNIEKSDKIELHTIKQHQEIINNFEYQGCIEIYNWLRQELGYGKNLNEYIDNQQPSS